MLVRQRILQNMRLKLVSYQLGMVFQKGFRPIVPSFENGFKQGGDRLPMQINDMRLHSQFVVAQTGSSGHRNFE